MYYDLHIHSKLSPCADDAMSVNNIVNMALLSNLQLISVTDHNSTRQQEVMAIVAKSHGLEYLYGVEVSSLEEVHVLCYFKELAQVKEFQVILEANMLPMKNDIKFFGEQLLFDINDQIIGQEDRMLSNGILLDLATIVDNVHYIGGCCVLAHVLLRKNSITNQLGFIPSNLLIDGIEVKDLMQKKQVIDLYPFLANQVFLYNSDAHYLVDINEDQSYLTKEEYQNLWRNSL